MTPVPRSWENLRKKILTAKRGILLLDFDGTVSKIVRVPSQAKLEPSLKKPLAALIKRPSWIVGVVSGRDLKTLQKKIPFKNIFLAGNHGFEISLPGKKTLIRPEAKKSRGSILKLLRELRKAIPGIQIEDKIWSATIHTRRLTPLKKKKTREAVYALASSYSRQKKIRITEGKEVLEIRPPAKWDKGKAVTYALKKLPSGFPIYIGDDATDEDAFRSLRKKGLTFKVGGKGKTLAKGRISSVKGLGPFLRYLLTLR